MKSPIRLLTSQWRNQQSPISSYSVEEKRRKWRNIINNDGHQWYENVKQPIINQRNVTEPVLKRNYCNTFRKYQSNGWYIEAGTINQLSILTISIAMATADDWYRQYCYYWEINGENSNINEMKKWRETNLNIKREAHDLKKPMQRMTQRNWKPIDQLSGMQISQKPSPITVGKSDERSNQY